MASSVDRASRRFMWPSTPRMMSERMWAASPKKIWAFRTDQGFDLGYSFRAIALPKPRRVQRAVKRGLKGWPRAPASRNELASMCPQTWVDQPQSRRAPAEGEFSCNSSLRSYVATCAPSSLGGLPKSGLAFSAPHPPRRYCASHPYIVRRLILMARATTSGLSPA